MEKEYDVLTFCDESNDIKEFCGIIKNLINGDLAVLYQVLMVEDKMEQLHLLKRKLRDKITDYPTLYNAYTAIVLVDDSVQYIKNEIISRFLATY